MAFQITVTVDPGSIARLKAELGLDARNVRKGVHRAINDTVRHLRAFASRQIREVLPLKKKTVDRSLRRHFAKRDSLQGALSVRSYGRISLRAYRARQTKRGGVTVVVDKRRGRQPAEEVALTRDGRPIGGSPKTFGPRIKRLGKGVFRRLGTARLPIERLYGPTAAEVFDQENMAAAAARDAQAYLERRLDYRLRAALR
jgi:hypothetical protein